MFTVSPPSLLSIPLWCDWDHTVAAEPENFYNAFNPTVVRLGLLGRCDEILFYCPFNPTVVRLGHNFLRAAPATCRPFNPTVVRLGPGYVLLGVAEGTVFQSHCGAIGTGQGLA